MSLIQNLPNDIFIYEISKYIDTIQLIKLVDLNNLWKTEIFKIIKILDVESMKYVDNNLLI